MFVFAAVARPSSGNSAAYLDGQLVSRRQTDQNSRRADGRSITITDELGHSSDGCANGPHRFSHPSLGITGVVNPNGQRMSWTNGTEWTRETKNPDYSGNLGGRWSRNGQATKIDVAGDGRNFTITNELGMQATGF